MTVASTRVMTAVLVVVVVCLVDRLVHHAQHLPAAATSEVAPQEQCGHDQEDDVQHGGVVPRDGSHLDLGVPTVWDKPRTLEDELDDQAGGEHGRVEGCEEEPHHSP